MNKELLLLLLLVAGCATAVVEPVPEPKPQPVVVKSKPKPKPVAAKPKSVIRPKPQPKTKFEKLQQVVNYGLANGIFHRVTPELNEVRMNPLVWVSLSSIDEKWATIELFEQYFGLLKERDGVGAGSVVTIRSSLSDEKLGESGFWGGYKVYR